MIPFDAWDVERVWHFTAGLCPRFREPLIDEEGRPVLYTEVDGFSRGMSARPPGTVSRTPQGHDLHCLDGLVHLRSAS